MANKKNTKAAKQTKIAELTVQAEPIVSAIQTAKTPAEKETATKALQNFLSGK